MKFAIRKNPSCWLGPLFLAIATGVAANAGEPEKAEAKQQLVRLAEEMSADNSPLVRRRAVRAMAAIGIIAAPELDKAADNDDYLVRLTAIKALCGLEGIDKLVLLRRKISDPEESVRLQVARELAELSPRLEEATKLLRKLREDSSQLVRDEANQALWPFYRDNIPIKQRTDYDHEVNIIKEIALPLDGWKFSLDPEQTGHLNEWQKPEFSDRNWRDISIGKSWENCGVDYDGTAWYRITFDLPEKPEQVAAELHFGAVDEDAWVWLNGVYLGQHVLGAAGWDKPFNLDATKELQWKKKNQLSVRVNDSKMAGGIWQPITIQIYK